MKKVFKAIGLAIGLVLLFIGLVALVAYLLACHIIIFLVLLGMGIFSSIAGAIYDNLD